MTRPEIRQHNFKLKLKEIARFFANKYNEIYGPFETSVATGNDIAIGGSNFKRIWSGIYKGAENKQYASQISFVMNPNESCLDVGFYFGRASGHDGSKEKGINKKEVDLLKTIYDHFFSEN